jgi:Amt family ammonium transporter
MTMRRQAAVGLARSIISIAASVLIATGEARADQPATVVPVDRAMVATEIPEVRTAEAVLVMGCTALGLLMVPAVGLFYGGMVRRKNVLSAFAQCFILLGIVPIQWAVAGYSLVFAPDALWGLCGGSRWLLLQGVGLEPVAELAPRLPQELFMVFQMMVAILPLALISGAIVERMKFSAFLVFSLLWTTLVYDPVAHWVWGEGGWIKNLGALDFGGGLVIHLTSGLAALCCALVLGKRKGLDTEDLHPHNLTLTALGTALLWFSWLGVNVGQARGGGTAAVAAFVATILATSAAIMSWSALEYFEKRKVTMLGICTGAIAGLVAVTPAAGYVTPVGAIVVGAVVCPFCYGAILLKGRLGYDDSLDVFGVHGIGALAGMLSLAILAAPALTGGEGGLLSGNADLLLAQGIAVLAVTAYTIVVTMAILILLDRVIGLRVSAEEEDLGLDLTQHGQRGYMMGEGELIGIEST